jgi:Predicted pyridoxal phosphate-dependent enzyme apparently involved in regulation of cell wall biogenesis
MTNLQAAVGLAQLERLSFFLSKKRKIGKKYHDLLSNNKFLSLPLEKTSYSSNCYWVFGVILKEEVHFDAHECIEKMASLKIGCRPFFYPLHRQPVLADYLNKNFGHFPVADHLSKRGFYLPSGLGISESQIEQVAEAINRILN